MTAARTQRSLIRTKYKSDFPSSKLRVQIIGSHYGVICRHKSLAFITGSLVVTYKSRYRDHLLSHIFKPFVAEMPVSRKINKSFSPGAREKRARVRHSRPRPVASDLALRPVSLFGLSRPGTNRARSTSTDSRRPPVAGYVLRVCMGITRIKAVFPSGAENISKSRDGGKGITLVLSVMAVDGVIYAAQLGRRLAARGRTGSAGMGGGRTGRGGEKVERRCRAGCWREEYSCPG